MRSQRKSVILLFACCLAIVVLVFSRWWDGEADAFLAKAAKTDMASVPQCVPEGELSNNLMTLESQLGGADVFTVERSLIDYAKKSPECRSQVVQGLMRAMAEARKRPETVFEGLDGKAYALWRNGVRLLVELKATEALDLLIANLDVTDGLSISMSHFPVVNAVIQIGEPAIPKLERVLNESSHPYMRKFAGYCIASIASPESKDILIDALPNETDACVSKFLGVSVKVLSKRAQSNHNASEARNDLISALYCSP